MAAQEEELTGAETTPTNGEEAAAPVDWDAVNRRRLDLIDKKYTGGGLSAAEQAEYEDLQRRFGEYLARAFPQPDVLSKEQLERLKARLEPSSGPQP